ncbi:hypothetical protein DFH09DRAFT_1085054 [Mycena vulgaris]|nr:hypothetical protein DFH09DRAFT_1085054 [Mycena vulgaris]
MTNWVLLLANRCILPVLSVLAQGDPTAKTIPSRGWSAANLDRSAVGAMRRRRTGTNKWEGAPLERNVMGNGEVAKIVEEEDSFSPLGVGAAVKLKKCKCDPPKKAARIAASTPEDSDVGRSSTQDSEGERGGTRPRVGVHTGAEDAQSAVVLDLCVENLVMFDAETGELGGNFTKRATSVMDSLTPDEALALVALAGIAGGAATADDAPGLEATLGQTRLLTSRRISLRVLDGAVDLPAFQKVRSGDDGSHIKADSEPKITSSARMEQARVTVAALNSRPFSQLFLIDVWLWDEVTPPGRRWWLRGAQMSREAWSKVATWRADVYETDDSWDSATPEE